MKGLHNILAVNYNQTSKKKKLYCSKERVIVFLAANKDDVYSISHFWKRGLSGFLH